MIKKQMLLLAFAAMFVGGGEVIAMDGAIEYTLHQKEERDLNGSVAGIKGDFIYVVNGNNRLNKLSPGDTINVNCYYTFVDKHYAHRERNLDWSVLGDADYYWDFQQKCWYKRQPNGLYGEVNSEVVVKKLNPNFGQPSSSSSATVVSQEDESIGSAMTDEEGKGDKEIVGGEGEDNTLTFNDVDELSQKKSSTYFKDFWKQHRDTITYHSTNIAKILASSVLSAGGTALIIYTYNEAYAKGDKRKKRCVKKWALAGGIVGALCSTSYCYGNDVKNWWSPSKVEVIC